MRIKTSKEFERAVRKQPGKVLDNIRQALLEIKNAKDITEISNCIRLTNFTSIYRIRIGSQRAFFHFHIKVEKDTIYLVPRGQAYVKEMMAKLRKKDGLKL